MQEAIFPCIREADPASASAAGERLNLTAVHVVYGSDRANFGGLLPSMLSLSRHLREPESCTIHLIVPEADVGEASQLLACYRRELSGAPAVPATRLHRQRPLAFDAAGFHTSTGSTHELVYAKFALHEAGYLPSAPRALWLDTDTLVQADVGPLFRAPMAHAIAATLDHPYATFDFHRAEMNASTHRMVRDWQARTFTTGVLLYDLDLWRQQRPAGELAALAQQLSGYDGEQLPMNLLFQGAFDQLDGRWNVVQPLAYTYLAGWLTSRSCIARAWVLHATGGKRKYWQAGSSSVFDDLLEPYLPKAPCEAWQRAWRQGAGEAR